MSELRHLANVLSLREPWFAPLCCDNMHLGPSGEASAWDASTLQPFLDSPEQVGFGGVSLGNTQMEIA